MRRMHFRWQWTWRIRLPLRTRHSPAEIRNGIASTGIQERIRKYSKNTVLGSAMIGSANLRRQAFGKRGVQCLAGPSLQNGFSGLAAHMPDIQASSLRSNTAPLGSSKGLDRWVYNPLASCRNYVVAPKITPSIRTNTLWVKMRTSAPLLSHIFLSL